jgi:hypothetical protein
MGWNHVFQVEVRPKFANKKKTLAATILMSMLSNFSLNLHPKDVVHVMCWGKNLY